MRLFPRLSIASAAIAASGSAWATDAVSLDRVTPVAPNEPVPVVDFFRPHLFENAKLSPSGGRFAALITNQHFTSNVLVCDIGSGRFEWSDASGDVVGFHWLSDEDLMVDVQLRTAYEGRIIHSGIQSTVRSVGSLDKARPDMGYPTKGRFGAVEGTDYVVEDPRAPVLPGGVPISYWAGREDGKAAFCVTQEDAKQRLYRYDGRAWLKSPVDPLETTPLAVGAKPGEMIVLGPRTPGAPRAVQYVDTVTGALGAVIYRDQSYDGVLSIFQDPKTWEPVGLEVPHIADHCVWFEPVRQRVQAMLEHFFPRSLCEIRGGDRTQNYFLIEEISDTRPPTYYLLDLSKKSLGLIRNEAPWIDPGRMQPMQMLSYRTRDGASIEAYLVLPKGASREHPVPLVVLPHGGPWERDYWGWDDCTEFLASRGYAVLRPNYRGSAGYDWRFAPGDRWDFAKMSSDVTDGTNAVIRLGLVDPGRVAILGGGFGAYLAVCGAVDEPNLYRCVITVGGIFDWKKAFDDADSKNDAGYDLLRRHLGSTGADYDNYAAISPLRRIANLRAPIFITNNLYGMQSDDITMAYPQISELSRALPPRVPRVLFGDLNIYSSNEAFADLIDRFKAIEKFLGANLGPRTQ